MNIFADVIEFITALSPQQQVLAAFLPGIALFALILRIWLFSAYKVAGLLVSRSAKGIKTKEDIKKLWSGAFGRGAREYVALAENGCKVDALALAEMALSKDFGGRSVLFFNFASVTGFVRMLERAFPIFCIFVFLGLDSEIGIAIMAVILYLLMLVFAAIFDIYAARNRFVSNLAHTLARDIGRFYPTDVSSAVYTFGSDLKEYLSRQSMMYNEVLHKIKTEFTGAIASHVGAMATSLDATLNAISKQEALEAVAEKWSKSLDKAAVLQAAMTESAAKIEEFSAIRGKMEEDIKLLTVAVQRFNLVGDITEKRNDTLEESLAMLRQNQRMLETTLGRYETSLQELTGHLGAALGAIVEHHLNTAGGQIANQITESVNAAARLNIEQAERIKSIFEEIEAQNRSQTRLLLKIVDNEGVFEENE